MDYPNRNEIIRSRRFEILRVAGAFVITIALMLVTVLLVGNFYGKQNIRILKQNVQRAAVECYSVEGIYPPNIEYLVNNYSLSYNSDKYYVFYETFASNVMPTVEVYERK